MGGGIRGATELGAVLAGLPKLALLDLCPCRPWGRPSVYSDLYSAPAELALLAATVGRLPHVRSVLWRPSRALAMAGRAAPPLAPAGATVHVLPV